MKLTRTAIEGDLKGLFPEIFKDPTHTKFINDYITVGVYLSAPDDLLIPLKTLESRLQERMFHKLGYDSTETGRRIQDARRKYYLREAQSQFNTSVDRLKSKINQQPAQKDPAHSKLLTMN
jgi:hypothetical protein